MFFRKWGICKMCGNFSFSLNEKRLCLDCAEIKEREDFVDSCKWSDPVDTSVVIDNCNDHFHELDYSSSHHARLINRERKRRIFDSDEIPVPIISHPHIHNDDYDLGERSSSSLFSSHNDDSAFQGGDSGGGGAESSFDSGSSFSSSDFGSSSSCDCGGGCGGCD